MGRQKNDIYLIREAFLHEIYRCVCVVPIDYEKAPFRWVFWCRQQKEDPLKLVDGDRFLYLPLFRCRELPAVVIFEGDRKPLLLNA